jgi:hypothetical protein
MRRLWKYKRNEEDWIRTLASGESGKEFQKLKVCKIDDQQILIRGVIIQD